MIIQAPNRPSTRLESQARLLSDSRVAALIRRWLEQFHAMNLSFHVFMFPVRPVPVIHSPTHNFGFAMKKTLSSAWPHFPRIVAGFIAAFLALVPSPKPAQGGQYGEFSYTLEGSAITITDFAGSGEMIIPDMIGGLPVTTLGDSAFSWHGSLTSVRIPGSVTTIERFFRNCLGIICGLKPIVAHHNRLAMSEITPDRPQGGAS